MTAGKLYKHIKCLDLNLFIIDSVDVGDYYKLKVMYVNDKNCLLWKESENVKVKKSELDNWRFIK